VFFTLAKKYLPHWIFSHDQFFFQQNMPFFSDTFFRNGVLKATQMTTKNVCTLLNSLKKGYFAALDVDGSVGLLLANGS
jgi:hypothetical protein